jgi:predicted acyltransferase (DUF342 family)
MAKVMAGYIRDVPNGTGQAGVSVTARDDLTGLAVAAGGMTMCGANPVSTDGDGFFTSSCELSPGPVRFEAVSGSQTKVRSGQETMQAVDFFLSDVPNFLKLFTNGVISGIKNSYNATVGGGTREAVLNTGDAMLRGYLHGIDTTRTLTHAANTTLAERWDLIVLQQWVAGTSKGKQSIVIVPGTVNVTDPTINLDANIFELAIWRARVANGSSAVVLNDLRTYSQSMINNNSITNDMITTEGIVSPAGIGIYLKAPASGNTPTFTFVQLNDLFDVAIAALADGHILQATGGVFSNVVPPFASSGHNHDATYVNASGDSMSGALSVTGNITATALIQAADMFATDDLSVGDDLDVGSDASILGVLTAGSLSTASAAITTLTGTTVTATGQVQGADLRATDDLLVGDDADIAADLTVGFNITALGIIQGADLVATDDLTVGDDATVVGTLTAGNVAAGTTIIATTTVQGADLIATDDLTVGDDASITGDLSVGGVVSYIGQVFAAEIGNSSFSTTNTSTVTFVTLIEDTITLPSGTWDVRVHWGMVGWTPSAGHVQAIAFIGGSTSTRMDVFDAADARRHVGGTFGVSGESGIVSIGVQFRGDVAGTTTGHQGHIFIIATRTA